MALSKVRRFWRLALTLVAILAIGGWQMATSSAQTRPERPQRSEAAAQGIEVPSIPEPPTRPPFTVTIPSIPEPPTMPPSTSRPGIELSDDMQSLIEDVIGDLEEFGETFARTIQELEDLLADFG